MVVMKMDKEIVRSFMCRRFKVRPPLKFQERRKIVTSYIKIDLFGRYYMQNILWRSFYEKGYK